MQLDALDPGGRHTRQNELVAFVEENLAIMTQNLNKTAEAYEAIDADHDKRMRQFLNRLGQ